MGKSKRTYKMYEEAHYTNTQTVQRHPDCNTFYHTHRLEDGRTALACWVNAHLCLSTRTHHNIIMVRVVTEEVRDRQTKRQTHRQADRGYKSSVRRRRTVSTFSPTRCNMSSVVTPNGHFKRFLALGGAFFLSFIDPQQK